MPLDTLARTTQVVGPQAVNHHGQLAAAPPVALEDWDPSVMRNSIGGPLPGLGHVHAPRPRADADRRLAP